MHDDGMSTNSSIDIMATIILKGKIYLWQTLRLAKGKYVESLEVKFEYAFNIMSTNQIFEYMLKDEKIGLLDEHKIPHMKAQD